MSWLSRLLNAAAPAPALPPVAAVAATMGNLVEASGVTIDGDEAGWRPLSTDGRRDLAPVTQARMQELAVYGWERLRLANRLVELPVAYLMAGGVRLECDDEEAAAWLSEFWTDPINRMDENLPDLVRELSLFGEQVWVVHENEIDGAVRLGFEDPADIDRVIMDPDNKRQPVGVVIRRPGGRRRLLRVIVNGPETIFGEGAQKLREGFQDGECFFWRINALTGGARGRSDLLSAIDWCDAYEELLYGELERAELMRAVLWDVEIKGATQEQLDAKAREIQGPRGPTTRVHNESEIWKAQAPALNSHDVTNLTRTVLTNILGGATIPGHWYGDGSDVNRASAAEMADPTLTVLTMRQNIIKAMLVAVGTLVIRRRMAQLGRADIAQRMREPAFQVRAVMPELSTKDASRVAAALSAVSASCISLIQQGLLTEETALGIIALIAGMLGAKIDPPAELEKAKKQAGEREAQQQSRDGFTLPPDIDQDLPPADAPDAPQRGEPE